MKEFEKGQSKKIESTHQDTVEVVPLLQSPPNLALHDLYK